MTATAYFDFDGTLIAGDSDVLFHIHLTELGRVTPELESAMNDMMAAYLAGRLTPSDFRDFQRVRARGWTPGAYRTEAERCFHTRVRPTLYAEAAGWIAAHRAQGHRVVIISAGTQPLIAEAGRALGCDAAYGVELDVQGTVFTGRVREPMPYAEGKITVARADASGVGHDLQRCFFYSDNAADLPLLDAVGHPRTVHPNARLEKIAAARGWPVHRPVVVAT